MNARKLRLLLTALLLTTTSCGMCRTCSDIMADEEPADVGSPQIIDRDGFRVEYPGNWILDDDAGDFDPDHQFTIESPGNCMVMFFIQDEYVDAQVMADKQHAAMTLVITDASTTDIDSWGTYSGVGYVIEGELLTFPATVTVFSHAGDDTSFTIVEQCYDDDMAMVEPGFELVRGTFELE